MNPTLKAYLIGILNAAVSGLATAGAGTVLHIGTGKEVEMALASAGVSIIKWMIQHPIPGGLQ